MRCSERFGCLCAAEIANGERYLCSRGEKLGGEG
jgi:hypothetical protein